MDPILLGSLLIVAMIVIVALGVPVGLSMAGIGFLGMWGLSGLPFALGTFMTLPYSIASQYSFAVVPMFVLMGAFAATSGMTAELYTAAYAAASTTRPCWLRPHLAPCRDPRSWLVPCSRAWPCPR